jgi:hypothetical protein
MEDNLVEGSIQVARTNWNKWLDVFEHGEPICTNPLLVKPELFASFLAEYSVGRTIRHGTHDEFRCALASQASDATRDDSGVALDALETDLRKRFGAHDPPRSILSALSKVAAFVRPERFVAWDRYARKGLAKVLGGAPSIKFDSYALYLEAFDRVWKGEPGQKIADYVKRVGAESPVEGELRFQRRVLDVYLMKCGDRKM